MEEKPKRCVFCGKDESFGEMNKEHFVPNCLSEKGTRPNHSQRTVPAHKTCNESLSDDNDYFRDLLVFEDGAKAHPEVQRLHAGSIARKFEKRFGTVVELLKDTQMLPLFDSEGLCVGFAPALPVDYRRRDRVLYNVMRGVFYIANGDPMPVDWQWGIKNIEDLPADVLETLNRDIPPTWHTFGDDVFACRYQFDHDKGAMGCFMRFYGRRIFFGSAYSELHMRAAIERQQGSLRDAGTSELT